MNQQCWATLWASLVRGRGHYGAASVGVPDQGRRETCEGLRIRVAKLVKWLAKRD